MPAVADPARATASVMPGRSRRPRAWVLALLVCLGLAALFAVGVWAHPGSRWLGYVGDPQQTTWFLRWTPYAIGHGWNPFLTTHIAYPHGVNLMWNTAVVLLGVVLAPVTLLFGPVVAYNVALVLAFALSGFACWVALRRVVPGVGPFAALAGAVFYEFSPYTTAHALGQLNMTFAVAPPLVLLLAYEMLVRRTWSARRAGLVLGLVAAGQALVSEEMLASCGVACLVLLVVLWAFGGRGAARARLVDAVAALSWSLVVFAVVMAWPLAVQFGGPQSLHGAVQRPGVFVTDLLNFVVPTQSQLLAPGGAVDFSQRFSGNPVEWGGYLGVPLLLLVAVVAVGGWRRRDRVVQVCVVCVAVFAVLSLGPSLRVAGVDTGVPLPWRALERVPLLGDMLPGRFALYVDLGVALLLAVAVQRLAGLRVGEVRRRALLGLAMVGVSVLPAVPLASDTVALPAFFTSGAAARLPSDGSVLVLPFSADFTSTEPMVWQALAGMRYRMPEGYAMIPDSSGVTHLGPPPTALSRALRSIATGGAVGVTDRAAYVADLRAWSVRAVVVGPMPHRSAAVAFVTALLGCSPSEHVGDVDVWWQAGASGCG